MQKIVDLFTFDLFFLYVSHLPLLLHCHLLLKLHELLLELVLVDVHVVAPGHHLVEEVRLHLHVQHLILQLVHLVDVQLLHRLLLCSHCSLQPLVLYNLLVTISLCALAASMWNTPCCSIFWCEL